MQRGFFRKLTLFYVLAIVLVTVLAPNTVVYGAPNDASLYEDVTEISDKSTILTRGNYLNYGAVTLTKIDSMRIRISGETAAHRVCDKLMIVFICIAVRMVYTMKTIETGLLRKVMEVIFGKF